MKQKKIVYVNFAPYDNAGRILDFLKENFSVVVHFSYDHLRLKNGRRSQLFIYENNTLVKHKYLLWMRTPPPLLFLSLPLVAFTIISQTYWEILTLKKKYGTFDIYFTVNGYTAWIGNLLRKVNLVKKTIFWAWDYFPPHYPDWRLRLARIVYLQFDNPAISKSDKTVFLNKKLAQIREDLGIIKKVNNYQVIPIGTNYIKQKDATKEIIIGHMGMLKWGQGLDLVFDNLTELIKKRKNLKMEIIGSGPDETHYRKRAKKFGPRVKFYGFVQDDDEVDRLISRWKVGIATYVPDTSSEHYWTDPSKIKAYINQGVPVVTTAVPEFAKEVTKYKAGIVIDY
jgi:glycosyltransferase involved in cell wall biosynthesis